ncbi:MAG: PQQ-binding-like beta-propeller repeat protein, partial [Planctomycetota bacterium]
EQTIVRLTRKGSVRWSTEVEDEVVGLAVDGLGRSVVVGTADGRLRRVTWTDMGCHGDSDELSF